MVLHPVRLALRGLTPIFTLGRIVVFLGAFPKYPEESERGVSDTSVTGSYLESRNSLLVRIGLGSGDKADGGFTTVATYSVVPNLRRLRRRRRHRLIHSFTDVECERRRRFKPQRKRNHATYGIALFKHLSLRSFVNLVGASVACTSNPYAINKSIILKDVADGDSKEKDPGVHNACERSGSV